MSKTGLFIVFEGVDGSGKSTHIKLIAEWLRKKGFKIHLTSEPAESPIGALIKSYAEGQIRNLSPETEALLFAANRREHLKIINEALKKDEIVISDRYVHSSLAYQGALGISQRWIKRINRFVRKPDLVILLDVDPESSLKRVRNRKGTIFEEKNYLQRVREIYLSYVEKGEILKFNATKSVTEIQNDIRINVKELLKLKPSQIGKK